MTTPTPFADQAAPFQVPAGNPPDVPDPRPVSGPHAEKDEARRQADMFAGDQGALFLEAEPDPMFVLNAERRVVCGNSALRGLLGLTAQAELIGLRFGELIACRDAGLLGVTCGSRQACAQCGAAQAMASALLGREDVRQCHVMLGDREHPLALNLLVRSAPFERAGERFVVFTAQDASHEIRRRTLERVFFQDILTQAHGLEQSMRAVAAAVRSASLDRDFSRDAQLMVDQFDALTDEIEWQRELLAAENNELAPRLEDVDGQALLGDLAARHKGHEAARGKLIRLATTAPALLRTDVRLLRRVLGNMLKNALEASVAGQTVTLACQPVGDEIRFSVHNQTWMPKTVQLQVFHRSFSTKGPGRGLGTYSMRLLSERFLGGRVWFETSPATGATFHASYPRALPVRPADASRERS